MMGKVRTITGMLGDRAGTWVSYEDFKKLEAQLAHADLERMAIARIRDKKATEARHRYEKAEATIAWIRKISADEVAGKIVSSVAAERIQQALEKEQ